MKAITSIVLLSIYTLNSFAQDATPKIRLVAGYPNYNYAPKVPGEVIVSAILKIKEDSLYEEKILTDSFRRLDFLRCYPDLNRIISLSKRRKATSESFPSMNYEFTIFNTNSLAKNLYRIPDTVLYNGSTYTFYPHEFSTIADENGTLFILKYVNFEIPETDKTTGVLYFIYNPFKKEIEKCDPDIYKKAVWNSANLVLQNNYEGEILIGDTVKNTLKIATTPFYKENTTYCDYLPANAKIPLESHLNAGGIVLVNSADVLVLHLYERVSKGEITLAKVRLFNKKNNQWDEFELETDWLIIRNFNQLLAGNFKINLINQSKNHIIKKDKKLVKEKTKYGPDYEDHFLNSGAWNYSVEGDLFIYSIVNKKMLTWNTGHRDSEILLIDKGIVYFRVDDTIFKADLDLERIKFNSQPLLLIKDERIRDVHWAF